MSARAKGPVVGILAGGRGLRMGGADKARLLTRDGEELLSRQLRLCRELGLDAVVIGGSVPAEVVRLEDRPDGIGPIGGLSALLDHAGERSALLLACDLPYLTLCLLGRLARADSPAAVLAPRDPLTGKWQPMFARYASSRLQPSLRVAIGDGVRSFQTFLRGEDVAELELDEAERAALRDWDRPEDLAR